MTITVLAKGIEMRILAVDDDPSILELLPLIAARAGFPDVTTMPSADLALDALEDSNETFDCLMLDIQMPGMDGIDLCRHVRAMPAYAKAPIIMLTAMTEKDYIDRAFRAGATDYATKPFDITELGARLRMAKELVTAQHAAAAARAAAQPRASSICGNHPFDLSDAVMVKGVKDVVDCTALTNYLAQLSRAGLVGTQVIAITIDQIESIYVRASTDEFHYALAEVADAASHMLSAAGHLMAYFGNGTFIVVSNKASMDPSLDLETDIQHLLDEKNTEYDNGDPLDIEISIGNPIRPNTSKTQGAMKTIDRAIARAENRKQRKRGQPRPINIRMVGD